MKTQRPTQLPAGSRPGCWLRRRRKGALAALTGLSTALAGCTTLSEYIHNGFKVGPNYHRPPAAVAPNWIDAADPRVLSVPTDDSNWWKVFNDPVLDDLVQ